MDKDVEGVTIIVVVTVITYISWLYYKNRDHEYVKAKDGNFYRVQISEDNKKGANLLAEVIKRCKKLIDHLGKSEPEDVRVKTLIDRFDPKNITENDPDEAKNGTTSYTVNKGDSVVICLRQRDGKFVDINTLMYVVIHEMAHICDLKSEQHDDRFWKNFEWLLNHAMNIGIYVYEDYGDDKKPYCGIDITSNVISS